MNSTMEYSYKLKIGHLIVLSITTFGLYELYWFYRNWKLLKEHKGLNINPLSRTLCLLIPFYSIYVIYKQFKEIKDMIGDCKIYSPVNLALSYWFFSMLSIKLAFRLPDPYSLLSFIPEILSIYILVLVQKALNCYWDKIQKDLPEKVKLTRKEKIVVVIGSVLLALNIISSLISNY